MLGGVILEDFEGSQPTLGFCFSVDFTVLFQHSCIFPCHTLCETCHFSLTRHRLPSESFLISQGAAEFPEPALLPAD